MSKKKRKLKKGVIFVLFLLLLTICYALVMYFIVGLNISNIYIYNNNNLTDQEIIELAKLQDYPNYYTTYTNTIKKRIMSNNYVKDVTIKKKFFKQVHIYIDEYNILFKKQEDNLYVLENGKEIISDKDIVNVPILINYVPNTKYDILINKLKKINYSIIKKISEIKYDPTELDEDRFLLYMNDSNYVYITLTKIDLLDKYNEAIEQLEGKNGILYLDSGNYFKIKK